MNSERNEPPVEWTKKDDSKLTDFRWLGQGVTIENEPEKNL